MPSGLEKSKTFNFEDFKPPEATTVGHQALKNPRPACIDDCDPSATPTVGHRVSKNLRPAFVEDFESPEPTVDHVSQYGLCASNCSTGQSNAPTVQSNAAFVLPIKERSAKLRPDNDRNWAEYRGSLRIHAKNGN